MKIQKKTNSKHKNTVKLKKINTIKKIGLFKAPVVSSSLPMTLEFKDKTNIKTYTFTTHAPSQEYYKNNFKKFFNDLVGIKKIPKPKIDLNSKKMLIKSLNTLVENIPFSGSSTNSSTNGNLLMTKVNRKLKLECI